MKTIAIFGLLIAFVSWSKAQSQEPLDFTLASALDKSKFVLSENRDKIVVLHFLLKTEKNFFATSEKTQATECLSMRLSRNSRNRNSFDSPVENSRD